MILKKAISFILIQQWRGTIATKLVQTNANTSCYDKQIVQHQ